MTKKQPKERDYSALKYKPIEITLGLPYKDDTPDYHFICDIDTPKAERTKNSTGDIYVNACKCLICGETVRSKNRHDYRSCTCSNVTCDGGSWYCKRLVREPSKAEEAITMFKDVPKDDQEADRVT